MTEYLRPATVVLTFRLAHDREPTELLRRSATAYAEEMADALGARVEDIASGFVGLHTYETDVTLAMPERGDSDA